MPDDPKPKRGRKTQDAPTREARVREASRARREKAKEDLRAQILTAAGEMFVESGYEGFSLRALGERIGYSATTIYLHFENKDDLLLAAAQEGFALFDRHISQAVAKDAEPLARLEALGRAYIEFGLANPNLYRLMFMQRSDRFVLPRLDDDFSQPEPEEPPRVLARALLVEAVRAGVARGVVKSGDEVQTADVLWAGAHGIVSLALSPLVTPEYLETLAEPLLATLIRGVQA